MRILLTLTLPLTLLVGPNLLVAAEPPSDQPSSAVRTTEDWQALGCLLDKDKNSALSTGELANFQPLPVKTLNRDFAIIDANQDGQISFEEYANYRRGARAAWETRFKAADTDQSGGLSATELTQPAGKGLIQIRKHFKEMDVNQDGQVTLDERDVFMAQAVGRRAGPKEGRPASRAEDARKDQPAISPKP